MQDPWRWRLQASWRVGDETRSYNPFFVDSAEEAEAASLEMTETLRHFVDLVVTVDRVDRREAEAEEERIAASEQPPTEVWVSPDFKRPD